MASGGPPADEPQHPTIMGQTAIKKYRPYRINENLTVFSQVNSSSFIQVFVQKSNIFSKKLLFAEVVRSPLTSLCYASSSMKPAGTSTVHHVLSLALGLKAITWVTICGVVT